MSRWRQSGSFKYYKNSQAKRGRCEDWERELAFNECFLHQEVSMEWVCNVQLEIPRPRATGRGLSSSLCSTFSSYLLAPTEPSFPLRRALGYNSWSGLIRCPLAKLTCPQAKESSHTVPSYGDVKVEGLRFTIYQGHQGRISSNRWEVQTLDLKRIPVQCFPGWASYFISLSPHLSNCL